MSQFQRTDTYDIRWGDTLKTTSVYDGVPGPRVLESTDIINVPARGQPRGFLVAGSARARMAVGSSANIFLNGGFVRFYVGVGQTVVELDQGFFLSVDFPTVFVIQFPAETIRAKYFFNVDWQGTASTGDTFELTVGCICSPFLPYFDSERRHDYR